jgi:hypothetical protein
MLPATSGLKQLAIAWVGKFVNFPEARKWVSAVYSSNLASKRLANPNAP